MKKVEEWRQQPGGGSGSFWENRVVEVADAKKLAAPDRAVPESTALHDWQPADGAPPKD